MTVVQIVKCVFLKWSRECNWCRSLQYPEHPERAAESMEFMAIQAHFGIPFRDSYPRERFALVMQTDFCLSFHFTTYP